jgi:hypothetical protein
MLQVSSAKMLVAENTGLMHICKWVEGYICGEETALIECLEGKPRLKPSPIRLLYGLTIKVSSHNQARNGIVFEYMANLPGNHWCEQAVIHDQPRTLTHKHSDAAVWFGPVFSKLLQTQNWTLGWVHQFCWTLDWTWANTFKRFGSGSERSEPWTGLYFYVLPHLLFLVTAGNSKTPQLCFLLQLHLMLLSIIQNGCPTFPNFLTFNEAHSSPTGSVDISTGSCWIF